MKSSFERSAAALLEAHSIDHLGVMDSGVCFNADGKFVTVRADELDGLIDVFNRSIHPGRSRAWKAVYDAKQNMQYQHLQVA